MQVPTKEQKEEKKLEIRYSKADDYRIIFVHQFFGGEREDHFEMVVQSLQVNAAESQNQKKSVLDMKDEVCLKMTPEQAKKLYVWLGQHLDTFEKTFREIKIGKGKTEKSVGFHSQKTREA